MEIPEAIKLIQEMKSWMPSDNKNFDKEREAIDTVLLHITTPNKTGLDDRLQDKSIEQPDNQKGLSSKKGIELPTDEKINKEIEDNFPFSMEYQKYNDREKQLMVAAAKAGAKWMRDLIQERSKK